MVDRIVPATTDEDRDAIAGALGVRRRRAGRHRALHPMGDRGPLRAGAAGLGARAPRWSPTSRPTSSMKLRLLNGSHSTLAYLGYLAGYETVSDAMRRRGLSPPRARPDGRGRADAADAARRRCRGLQARAARALRQPGAAATAPGRSAWTARRSCRSACSARSATGSRPARRSTARAWASPAGCATSPASTSRASRSTCAIRLSARLRAIADKAGLVAERLAPALLDVREIFTAELAADPRFRAAVTDALSRIIAKGAKVAVAEMT